MTSIIIFFVALVATMLSSMSGGGSGLIATPVWLMLGMSYPVAMTIQSVCSLFWCLPASFNYLHGRKVDWVFLSLFAVIGMTGALLGTLIVVSLTADIVHIAIGILILLLVLYTALKKDIGIRKTIVHSAPRQFLAYPGAIILGFYEIVFGAGNGIAFTLLTFWTRGFDFIDALGYYYAVAFFWSALAVLLLSAKGYLILAFAVPAVLGSILGGYIGSRFGRYKGNTFIKTVFVVIGGVLGLKLVLGF